MPVLTIIGPTVQLGGGLTAADQAQVGLTIGAATADTADRLDDLREASQQLAEQVDKTTQDLRSRLEDAEDLAAVQAAALAGQIEMSIDSAAENITAASLNAAAAGTLKREFAVTLRVPSGLQLHSWASLTPVVTPAEVATDPQIGVPTLDQIPLFSAGRLRVRLTTDTDAGATKTYQAGDVLTVTVAISSIPAFTGVANVIKTYNVT